MLLHECTGQYVFSLHNARNSMISIPINSSQGILRNGSGTKSFDSMWNENQTKQNLV